MQTFTLLAAAFATLNTVTGSPLLSLIARDVCGTAPSASGSQNAIEQPANIQTAAACQSACDANTSCKSFLFGMVDNSIKCMLFSVAANAIPKQSSANLIAYDKACGSVPVVTPTAQNPTGVNSGNTNQGTNQGTNQEANNNNNNQQGANPPAGGKVAARDTCGGAPAGNANQAPINTPANINSVADCLAQCKANPACKSFEFGSSNGGNVCRLFSVPAASAPSPGAGESFQAFDVGCSI
ncbi:hypothetical protein K469DRAFT_593440 [Zopfia rhizophila CBS 207.26]|uniref:Apple domain-containing protein n=1 Tax=Zopfia rhizophila CBS 207.26 TaxID=1314779 RepID=A0A6A6DKY5_9PEZI|nr:hypothetical protein K469DRAFT_593440 [Zopfia rhizophila CBS 207.26]